MKKLKCERVTAFRLRVERCKYDKRVRCLVNTPKEICRKKGCLDYLPF